ncbi:hypothetical protein J6590_043624 [Homalodisca vitripennis]|nr:hypothetical protein J6590_043624 [Homalodisca vitripennis]
MYGEVYPYIPPYRFTNCPETCLPAVISSVHFHLLPVSITQQPTCKYPEPPQFVNVDNSTRRMLMALVGRVIVLVDPPSAIRGVRTSVRNFLNSFQIHSETCRPFLFAFRGSEVKIYGLIMRHDNTKNTSLTELFRPNLPNGCQL